MKGPAEAALGLQGGSPSSPQKIVVDKAAG